MRTVVTAITPGGEKYTHDSAGVFGELRESRYKKDRHDIASMGSGILQVLFTPRWEENNATYFSDYRKRKRGHKHKERVWSFQVVDQKSVDLSDAYWTSQGIMERPSTRKRLFKRLKLVDVDNHQVYRATNLENVTFDMDGNHTRTFRWVIGRVKPMDYKPLPGKAKVEF